MTQSVAVLSDREIEIAITQKLIEHGRHQRRVGTITKMGRQCLSHAEFRSKLHHYVTLPRPLAVDADEPASPRGSRAWLLSLTYADFRAYQSRLADIDISQPDAFAWWFRLGDEQRYSLIRASGDALRDEHEQEKKYRYLEKMKSLRESGQA